MKTGQIRKLLAAGFAELWRDPDNGQLYIRAHAWNVLHARSNERKGHAASSEGLKQESALRQTSQVAEIQDDQSTKADESKAIIENEGRGGLAGSEQGQSDASSLGEVGTSTPPLSNERPSELLADSPPQIVSAPLSAKEWVERLREDCHATYNGGHHDAYVCEAFHHGMDTVCNVLAGGALEKYASSSNAALQQKLELFEENFRAAIKRLDSEGVVLFNYPSIPEGCRSNIQWRNVRAEAAANEIHMLERAAESHKYTVSDLVAERDGLREALREKESRKIEVERETDGRWIVEITDVPGVMAYGGTPQEALENALNIAADAGEHRERLNDEAVSRIADRTLCRIFHSGHFKRVYALCRVGRICLRILFVHNVSRFRRAQVRGPSIWHRERNKVKLKEIATEINGYLQKFEADPAINRRKTGNVNIPPYFRACSWHSGRYVGVRYVSFQGTTYLSRQSAEQFLAWLRQGGIGTHYKAGVDA